MADVKDKVLVQAKDGYAPQYYNDITKKFEVAQGIDGKMLVSDAELVNAVKGISDYVVMDSFSATGETERRYSRGAYALTVVNDGTTDVTIDVLGFKVTVKPYEVFSENFNRFADLKINGEAYRVIVKGVVS